MHLVQLLCLVATWCVLLRHFSALVIYGAGVMHAWDSKF